MAEKNYSGPRKPPLNWKLDPSFTVSQRKAAIAALQGSTPPPTWRKEELVSPEKRTLPQDIAEEDENCDEGLQFGNTLRRVQEHNSEHMSPNQEEGTMQSARSTQPQTSARSTQAHGPKEIFYQKLLELSVQNGNSGGMETRGEGFGGGGGGFSEGTMEALVQCCVEHHHSTGELKCHHACAIRFSALTC
eukprot:2879594-Rhodomonas_salina.2